MVQMEKKNKITKYKWYNEEKWETFLIITFAWVFGIIWYIIINLICYGKIK
jgi:hypothetical protein